MKFVERSQTGWKEHELMIDTGTRPSSFLLFGNLLSNFHQNRRCRSQALDYRCKCLWREEENNEHQGSCAVFQRGNYLRANHPTPPMGNCFNSEH